MAYFPNGTAGEFFDEGCFECLHHKEGVCCPVYLIQNTFNYRQVDEGQEDLKKAMTMLVDAQGICQMKKLIEPYLPDFNQGELFNT